MLTNHSASENYQARPLAIRFGVSLVAIIISAIGVATFEWWRRGSTELMQEHTPTSIPNHYGRIDWHTLSPVVIVQLALAWPLGLTPGHVWK